MLYHFKSYHAPHKQCPMAVVSNVITNITIHLSLTTLQYQIPCPCWLAPVKNELIATIKLVMHLDLYHHKVKTDRYIDALKADSFNISFAAYMIWKVYIYIYYVCIHTHTMVNKDIFSSSIWRSWWLCFRKTFFFFFYR